MAGQQGGKGNPATHRMGNARRKARRAECWTRGQKRKDARRKAAEQAHQRNVATVAEGGLTPWQVARLARHARRHPETKAA